MIFNILPVLIIGKMIKSWWLVMIALAELRSCGIYELSYTVFRQRSTEVLGGLEGFGVACGWILWPWWDSGEGWTWRSWSFPTFTTLQFCDPPSTLLRSYAVHGHISANIDNSFLSFPAAGSGVFRKTSIPTAGKWQLLEEWQSQSCTWPRLMDWIIQEKDV